jgi:DNA-binding NtrC family response regulator
MDSPDLVPAPHDGAIFVLVVEDEFLVRFSIADELRAAGLTVVEAANATDVNASGEARFSLATWIRQNYPGTQVILAGTMATAAEKAGDLCQDGPALSKPYDHRLVLDHIKRLLAARDRG